MRIADQKNFVAGVLYLLIGSGVAIGASRYRLGSAEQMGPGYFPLIIGVALALCGVWVILGSLARGGPLSPLGRWSLRPLLIVLAAIVVFATILATTGLIIAIPVLVAMASFAHPQFSWRRTLITIAVLVPLTWVIFIVLLGLQIPFLPPGVEGR